MNRRPHPEHEPHPSSPCDLELLALFGAGELDPARRDAVSAHLLACDRCWAVLEAQRAAVAAVHTLWEPAPVGLRADIRAAISAAQPQLRHRRRRVLLAAAAVIAVATAGGVVADRRTSTTDDHRGAATTTLPAPIRAAIAEARTTPLSGPAVPPAPELGSAGLRLTALGATTAGGIAAARYDYADHDGHRVTVFVAVQAWPRPDSAVALGTRTWLLDPSRPAAPTVVGGPDDAGENMLVVAADHTAIMTAAAQLGLV